MREPTSMQGNEESRWCCGLGWMYELEVRGREEGEEGEGEEMVLECEVRESHSDRCRAESEGKERTEVGRRPSACFGGEVA